MKLRKKLIPFLVLTACLVLFCSMPVFAAELTEADGVDNNLIPRPRLYTLRLNINF